MTPRRSQIACLAAAAALLLLAAGCAPEDQQAGGGFARPPTPVEVFDVAADGVVDRFTAVGSLDAVESIAVSAEIDGTVTALPFAEGRPLAAGDVIARLDDAELTAQADRAAAVLVQRRAARERVAEVADQGAGTPQDLDDAVAAEQVAAADLALARARLAKTRITAPFAGTAGARRVSVGAYVRPGTEITDLADLSELRVNFAAPERMLGRLALGAEVEVRTSAWPDRPLVGAIDVIEPVLDAGTRSARIVARVSNPDRRLRPGMSAEVSVVLDVRPDALTVPSEAVFVQDGQSLVYVVAADSTVAPRPVVLGLRRPDSVEIVEGLAAGDRVVRTGHQKLYPGAKVAPIAPAAAADGTEAGS